MISRISRCPDLEDTSSESLEHNGVVVVVVGSW